MKPRTKKKQKQSTIPLPTKYCWTLFYLYILCWLGGATAPHCLFIFCDVGSWRGMESLSAERDCSTLVRWWEGGGSAWNCGREEGGRENAAVQTFPGWERVCRERLSLQALKPYRGKTRKRANERESEINKHGLITERRELWRMRRGRRRWGRCRLKTW